MQRIIPISLGENLTLLTCPCGGKEELFGKSVYDSGLLSIKLIFAFLLRVLRLQFCSYLHERIDFKPRPLGGVTSTPACNVVCLRDVDHAITLIAEICRNIRCVIFT